MISHISTALLQLQQTTSASYIILTYITDKHEGSINTLKVGGTPAERQEEWSRSQGLNLNAACQRGHLHSQWGFGKYISSGRSKPAHSHSLLLATQGLKDQSM